MINKNYILIVCAILFAGTHYATAQGGSFSNVWVGAGAEMHIRYANNVTFNANVKTDRNSETSVVSFASLNNASTTGHVDGRVKVYNPGALAVLPAGFTTENSPVRLTSAAQPTQPVTSLFNRSSAGNEQSLDADLMLIAPDRHWKVSGNNSAMLTFIWQNAGYSAALQSSGLSAADMTLAAWDGTKWIAIPSTVSNSSTPDDGSLTTNGIINLNTYTLFTLAVKNGCVQLVNATGNVAYNGIWSGLPTEFMDVTINNGLTILPGTSFKANSLVLNADVTITNGAYLEVQKGVTGSGKLIIASEGSFVQRSSSSDVPQIVLTKATRPLRKWDHAYWGTPVQEDFTAQIANAKAIGYQMAAFDQKMKYISEAGASGSWQNLDQIVPGKGFITRVKSQIPFINEVATNVINFPITGTANNGNVAVELGSAVSGARSFNLLANPYPSAIDAGELLRGNPNLGGAIYLWTAKGFNSVGATADYAIWTLAGSVVTSPIAQQPTGYIASGQGFMVKGLSANGTVNFTNCMRVTGQNNNFFRATPSNRYWLNLTNESGIFSQILVNYTEEATYGADRLYDAQRNSMSTAQLYSYIGDTKYAVNGRPVFDITDSVPVGVSRTAADGESFSIAIDHTEGIFTDGDVTIILHDKLLDVHHNLNLSSYNFSASELQNNDRFEIVYQNATLGVNDPAKQDTTHMSINKSQFAINANGAVNSVMIFEITGRLIQQYKVGNTNYTAPFNHSQGVYIAKAKMGDGTIVTRKLINGN